MLKKYRKTLFIFIMLSTLITAMEIVGEFVFARETIGVSAWLMRSRFGLTGVAGLGLFLILCIMGLTMLMLIFEHGLKTLVSGGRSVDIFTKPWFSWLIIFISWIPCFLAYFPVIYSYDGQPQLIQYTTGNFSAHHPIFHTLLLGWCYDLGRWLTSLGLPFEGLALYSIIQMVVLSWALSSCIVFMAKRRARLWYLLFSLVVFGLSPVNAILVISTTKDVIFSAFFLLLVLSILDLESAPSDDKSIFKEVKIGIYSVFMMLFRPNGVYVLAMLGVSLGIVLLIKNISKKSSGPSSKNLFKLLISIFFSILIFTVFNTSLLHITKAIKGESAEALSIPLQQMARAYKSNEPEFPADLKSELLEYISEEGLNNYRPHISDSVKLFFNNEKFGEDKADFIKLYFKIGMKYPSSYILAFLYLTEGDYQISDVSFTQVYKDWWRDRTGYLITDAKPVFGGDDFVHKKNLWPSLRDMYEKFATELNFRKVGILEFLFSPALYVWITVLGGIFLLRFRKAGRRSFLAAWGVIGFYTLTMLAGPCVLIRYVFPLMITSPLIGWMCYWQKYVSAEASDPIQ